MKLSNIRLRTPLAAVLLAAALLLHTEPINAQRTSSGSSFLSAGCIVPSHAVRGVGATLDWGRYTDSGYWTLGASAVNRVRDFESCEYDVLQALGGAGWYWRLAGSRSRWLNIYAGGDVLLGVESIDPKGMLSDGKFIEVEKTYFVYGLDARLECEVYFTQWLGLALSAGLPVVFNSYKEWLSGEASLGIRVNF